jgi:hypothetical protein
VFLLLHSPGIIKNFVPANPLGLAIHIKKEKEDAFFTVATKMKKHLIYPAQLEIITNDG